MDGTVFPENIPVANAQVAPRPPVKLQVLRFVPDHRAHVNLIVAANDCMPGNVRIRPHPRARPNLDVIFNDGMRPDVDRWIEFRLRTNNGCGMNRHGCQGGVRDGSMRSTQAAMPPATFFRFA